jgi:hypothetical protein
MVAKFCLRSRGGLGLVFYRFVVAGGTAGLAVHQAVGAEADVELRLAEDTELLAPASRLDLLALGAHDAAGGFGGHASSLVRRDGRWNVTEVTEGQVAGSRGQVSGKATPSGR